MEQQCQDILLRSKPHCLAGAAAFPYSPTGSLPGPSSAATKCPSLLLPQQQNKNKRYPGSRQIYLTFPADSTFREEDVSNYFSIYGPVRDVRIPWFVTFVYLETLKLIILAKGNPHFVCDARVLVKPYKEKGKVPDKYRKQRVRKAPAPSD